MNELIALGSFSLLALASVIFAFLVVEQKSLVYSALCLGLLGIVNAGLFALLGYLIIALFHLIVYVGAAVTFILFSVTMFKEVPDVETRMKALTLLMIPLVAIALFYIFRPYSNVAFAPKYFAYGEISSLFVKKYWFPLIVTALTLVTTLIEAITLARREEESV